MKAKISARGYTNVILVLNMKRFVAAEDRERFESIEHPESVQQTLYQLVDWGKRHLLAKVIN